jgi:enoyl-CoA hydratase/carnithine racemase
MELILTGRRLKADEAAQLGLITRSFAPGRLDEELEAVIRGILRGSPAAIKRTKEFVWHCEDISNRAGMISAVDSISIGITSDEAREGIGAFLEKRTPKWA